MKHPKYFNPEDYSVKASRNDYLVATEILKDISLRLEQGELNEESPDWGKETVKLWGESVVAISFLYSITVEDAIKVQDYAMALYNLSVADSVNKYRTFLEQTYGDSFDTQ